MDIRYPKFLTSDLKGARANFRRAVLHAICFADNKDSDNRVADHAFKCGWLTGYLQRGFYDPYFKTKHGMPEFNVSKEVIAEANRIRNSLD